MLQMFSSFTGAWLQRPEIAALVGIKQTLPIYTKPAHTYETEPGGPDRTHIHGHRPQPIEIVVVIGRAEVNE